MASPLLPSRRSSSSSYLYLFPLGFLILISLSLFHLYPGMSDGTVVGQLPFSSGPQKPFPSPGKGEIVAGFKVGTFNLRYDGGWRETVPVGEEGDGREEEGGGGEGERPWSERRWRIRDQLKFLDHDIVGFQECLHTQLLDLQALLGPSWSNVGVGRDDGKTQGEYAPIFFNSDRFKPLSVEYVWLSETPGKVGSTGWDASQPRIATILTLLDDVSNSLIHVANTHWDDRGLVARHESGKLLRRIVPETARRVEKKLGKGDGKRLEGVVLLMGDLNSPSEEAGYQAITLPSTSLSSLSTLSPFSDHLPTPPFHFLPTLLSLSPHPSFPFGPRTTYTGFHGYPTDAPTEIDFIFLYDESVREGGWGVERYGVVEGGMDEREQEEEGRWRGKLSDHRFVGGEVVRRL